jgi:hypothetical protein
VGAAVLADLVVAVVQAVPGVARALVGLADRAPGEVAVLVVPVAHPVQVLGADLGEMMVTAVHPGPIAIVLIARLVPLATVSVDHMATAQQGHSVMATADLRVLRATVSDAPMVIARRVLRETANAEVLVTGQNDRVARRAMANADLTATGQAGLTATGQADLLVREASDLHAQQETASDDPMVSVRNDRVVHPVTASAEVLVNGQIVPVARRVMVSGDLTATDLADLLVREASDLHAQQETESVDLTASVQSAQVVQRAMANADHSATGRAARRLAGNGPSGSAESSDGMTASEVLNFQIR